MTGDKKPVPEPTLRRLPTYVHYLRRTAQVETETISTSLMAKELKLDPTQVRKDLACTGVTGTPKVGYNIDRLIDAIENFLGWDNVEDAFLVGVGNLGKALLSYERLSGYGVNIVAAFDVNPALVGTSINGVKIIELKKMKNLIQRMNIHIGIITTPAGSAMDVAEKMIDGGIKAIWNFAPISIDSPDNVIVQNMDLYASLAVLSKKLKQQLKHSKRKNR